MFTEGTSRLGVCRWRHTASNIAEVSRFVARVYPEIPITIAGTEVPSLMIHQLLLSALSKASSSRSCRRIGKFWSLRSLTAFMFAGYGT